MKSNKILHIKEAYLNLPNDFNGTLGEALMLMAKRAILAEQYSEVNKGISFDLYDDLIKSEKSKCIIAYEIIDAKDGEVDYVDQ